MADIVHILPIKAPISQVFRAVSTPDGLQSWWTKGTTGEPGLGAQYELWFGPKHDWRAVVSQYIPETEFELEITSADEDWQGTRVSFRLKETDGVTVLRFHHSGWPKANDHYEVSCYCWALYLRLLTRYVEKGEVVPYDERLAA
jgi:uncharacterized protein YndB with AHSA1/START domain